MSTTPVCLHGMGRDNFTFTLYGTYKILIKLYGVKYMLFKYFYPTYDEDKVTTVKFQVCKSSGSDLNHSQLVPLA
jgi:hypothetical protein